jgi:CarD family transcriptional regulator
MAFQVGDQVIHAIYGPGKIIQLDEKKLRGQLTRYYVVQVSDLTLWVPVDQAPPISLRYPTSAGEFTKMFGILSGPAQPLSEDRMERKSQLSGRLKEGKIESICRVVCDLTAHRRIKKLNDVDKALLERALNSLLTEWCISFNTPLPQARKAINRLLGEDVLPAD